MTLGRRVFWTSAMAVVYTIFIKEIKILPSNSPILMELGVGNGK